MFSVTPRSVSRKLICAAAAIAVAALALALAGSAAAVPNDTILKMDSDPNHTFQFGGSGSCVANQPPSADGNLDWREDLVAGTVNPRLTGSLCLQKTTGTFRVALEYYYDINGAHDKIGTYGSLASTGNGAALNSFSVNLSGPVVLSGPIDHVHVVIQQQVAGVWQNVGSARVVDYP
jgi:hypothetical protein